MKHDAWFNRLIYIESAKMAQASHLCLWAPPLLPRRGQHLPSRLRSGPAFPSIGGTNLRLPAREDSGPSRLRLRAHLLGPLSSLDLPIEPIPCTKEPDKLGAIADTKLKSLGPQRWSRVLLKVSGEALAGDGSQNIDPKILMSIAKEVAIITHRGTQVAIVIGGGNFFRGSTWAGLSGLDRASADYIGMMATVMNALFLQASMESIGIQTRVQTAFRIAEVAEPYIRRRAIRHLEKGRVVIFGAGTGNPFFTTDTAAALRAAEINAEAVLKATNVDGVYDSDPKANPHALLLDHLSYRDVTLKGLSVMDISAITLCQENNIPVVVFNLHKPGNISRALNGEPVGTLIDHTGNIS